MIIRVYIFNILLFFYIVGELYHVLGDSYYRIYVENNNLNYLKESQKRYSEAIKYNNISSSPSSLFDIAIVYYEYGLYDESLKILTQIIERFKDFRKIAKDRKSVV